MSFALEDAQKILVAQPFNRAVGARLTLFEPGEAVLELDIEERHRQQYGVVHGGVYAYLADNSLTFAAGSVLGTNVITAGMTVSYLRAARGGVLRAHATVEHHDKRQAACSVRVSSVPPEGGSTELCAIAQGTVLVTRQSDPVTTPQQRTRQGESES